MRHQPDQFLLQVELDDPSGEVWIEGRRMDRQGPIRDFVSPRLEPGAYSYTVEARWGAARATQTVAVRPGGVARVRLHKPKE